MRLLVLVIGLFSLNVFAETVKINVETPLRNTDLIKMVQDSVADYLEYSDENIAGGLMGDIENPTIIVLEKEGNLVTAIEVRSNAYYFSTDFDFGDPVDEEHTVCNTRLEKQNDGNYTAVSTKCNYDPTAEAAMEETYADWMAPEE